MVDIADILPSSEPFSIRGTKVEVVGLALPDLVKLGQRFPALVKLLDGFKLDALLDQPREVLGAVLAAGIGKLGDAGVERGLGNLKLGEQAAMAAAVVRQTGGFIPFAELLGAIAGAVPGPEPTVAESLGKVRLAKRSQPELTD
jgi:hypothetical protein